MSNEKDLIQSLFSFLKNNKEIFINDYEKEYDKGITPLEFAKSISGRLAKEALIAEINGSSKDLHLNVI